MVVNFEGLEPLPGTSTPKDYIRWQFDPSQVPAKRIVGLLACQRDPLLRQLTTRVTSARPAPILAVPTQKGKGQKKKDKSGANTPSGSATGSATPVTNGTQTPVGEAATTDSAGRLWEVELEDTVIFPEGGGQPSDTGSITISDPDGTPRSFRVEMCIRRKLDSVHLIRANPEDEGTIENLVGRKAVIDVDWIRRSDQMTIHTAQHLLSAVLDTYSLPTLSWSMHAHPSLECPYIELERQLTWAEVAQVEAKCNAHIAEAKRVWIEVSVQGRQDGEEGVAGDDERESRGLPKDYAGGVIRHCCIDGIDRNACCGTQLPHIGMIQSLHVIPPSLAFTSTTPSKSNTKLYFTAGPRLNRYLAESSRQLSLTCQALGSSREDLARKAAKTEELRIQGGRDSETLRKELSKLVAESAVDSLKRDKGVIWIQRSAPATNDFEFLGNVATHLMGLESFNNLGKEGQEGVVVCTSAIPGEAGGLILIMSKDDTAAKALKDKLAHVIDALPAGTATPSQAPRSGEKGSADSGKGAEGSTAIKRVKGGGARGRYMCKVDGKFGGKEKQAVGGVLSEVRADRQ